MRCQFDGCRNNATHCLMCLKELRGFFCQAHAYKLVETNWICKIEKYPDKVNMKNLSDFGGKL